MVSKLGFSINYFDGMHIRLGDDHRIWVHERYTEIDIKLSEYTCTLKALIFYLSSLDMVLGNDWLMNLGEVVHNWKEQSINEVQTG